MNINNVEMFYYLVLRVIVLVTLVVPLERVVRVVRVVVLPLFVTLTVLRVTFAIILSFIFPRFQHGQHHLLSSRLVQVYHSS